MNLINRIKICFYHNIMLYLIPILYLVLIQSAFSNDTANTTADEIDIQQIFHSLGISESNGSLNDIENFTEALQAFIKAFESDDEKTLSLLKDWDNYLIEVTHYSNDLYIRAMQSEQSEYSKALSALDNRIAKIEKKNNEYSSSWIDDLTNHFGINFIKENRDSVMSSLKAILISDESYKKELKDLIYTEAMLIGSYKQYYGHFLDFYNEELDKNSQKKLETRKKLAEAILKITANKPLTSMYNTSDLQKKLAENEALQLNDEVYKFLKDHPLSYTFSNLIRELKDFDKAIGRQ